MRTQYLVLLVMLLLAFAVRLAYWERSAGFGSYELSYDDDEYFKAAQLFARGEWLRDPYPLRYTRSPGYPLALAPLVAAFGPRIELVLAFQVGVSVLTVALMYVTARRAFGARAGAGAAGLMALCPTYAALAGSFLLTETLFTFTVLLFIYLLWRWSAAGLTVWRALGLGVILGYAALVRGQALYFALLAAAWLAYRAWREKRLRPTILQLVPLVLGTVLVIAPWTWRNELSYQRFILLDTNSGWTVWRDHRVPEDDFWTTLPRISNPSDRANYAMVRGLANIAADPFRQIVVNGAANLAGLARLELDSFARGGGYLTDVITDAPDLAHAAWNDVFYLVTLCLALAGLILQRKRLPGLLMLWLALELAFIFAFHMQNRFRAHYLFVLIVLAGGAPAAAREWKFWRAFTRREAWIWLGASAVVLALAYSPRLAPLFASEFYLARSGGTDIAAAQDAAAVFPEYARAHDVLGDAYRRAGKFPEALGAYDAALALNPFEMQAHLGKMDVFRQQGDATALAAQIRAAGVESGEVTLPAPLWWSFDPAPTRLVEMGDSTSSFGYILNLYAIQTDGGERLRFTEGRSFVKFPGVNGWNPSRLVMYAREVPRPDEPPTVVEVRLNGREAGQVTLNAEWQDYEIPLDAAARASETLVVEFRSATFRPSDLFEGSDDTRDLGFMLGYVELR